MQSVECEFESEVLAAVVQSRWPERVEPQLRAHAEGCVICSDVAAIAGVIDSAREEMRVSVTVPDSGRVWWLAQLRARREAAKAANRPITAAQLIAGACAVGLTGACFGATSAWFQAALKWLGSNFALLASHGALALGMAAVLFLVPAAAWLVLRRD
jgi:hypothetical protein